MLLQICQSTEGLGTCGCHTFMKFWAQNNCPFTPLSDHNWYLTYFVNCLQLLACLVCYCVCVMEFNKHKSPPKPLLRELYCSLCHLANCVVLGIWARLSPESLVNNNCNGKDMWLYFLDKTATCLSCPSSLDFRLWPKLFTKQPAEST